MIDSSTIADKSSGKGDLTDKQRRFVEEYLVDLNSTQAAIRSGYSRKTAHSIGWENLRKPEIAAAISAALAERNNITRTRIIDELASIAFANAGDYFEWGPEGVTIKSSTSLSADQMRAVSEVTETRTKDGGTTRIKLSDKQAALERLGKLLGLQQDRVEVTEIRKEPTDRELAKATALILRKGLEQQDGPDSTGEINYD